MEEKYMFTKIIGIITWVMVLVIRSAGGTVSNTNTRPPEAT